MAKREEVKCEKCGGVFDRSVFHPYLKLCVGCRDTAPKTKGTVKKGSSLRRIDVACEKCGAMFSRSVAHPYITKCPECRDTKKAIIKRSRRIGCRLCRDHLKSGTHKAGMFICRCEAQYWLFGDGWYHTWAGPSSDPAKLFYREHEVGVIDGEKSTKVMMEEYDVEANTETK